MKKVAFLAAFFGCVTFASADEVVQIAPATVEAGVSFDDSEAHLVVSIPTNATKYQGVNFELFVPQGVEIDVDDDFHGVALPSETKKGKTTWFHTFQINKQTTCDIEGYDRYRCLLSNTANQYFIGDGELCALWVAAENLPEGVYPIYMGTVKMTTTGAAGSATTFDMITSYLKVGENGASIVKAEGLVPQTVTTALAAETAISKLDLSEVTAVNGTFTYVDGREVVAPTADLTATAAYSKTVASGKYASLTMPFAADLTGMGAYKLTSVESNTANFEEAKSVSAGDVVLLTQDVDLTGDKIGAATKEVKASAYYVAPDGSELRKGTNVTVNALRGSWDVVAGSNLRIALDGVLTGITAAEIDADAANTFDLQGRQTTNAKNGVFVVNGKKQFVK